jgi:competence protein ComEC
MQTEEGKVYLFDGGSSSKDTLADDVLIPFLKSKGVKTVDYAVVSHSDSDHISGILQLLKDKTFAIKTLVLPNITGWEADKNYCELVTLAKENGVYIMYTNTGDDIGTENVSVKCVHPAAGYKYTSANEYSAVYLIEYGNFRMLMTGDADEKAEEAMKTANVLSDIDVLKVAHHGSKSSTSESFLKLTSPECAVISCGINNSYGHPSKETLNRLEKAGAYVYTTAQLGEIVLKSDGGSYTLEKWRE